MRAGTIIPERFEVRSSKFDQRLDAPGWSFPNKAEKFETVEEAFKRFNEVVADPEIAKATLTWNIIYVEEYDEKNPVRSTGCNQFTIAHYDHKAQRFESFAMKNNFWKTNRGKYSGIYDRYVNDVPEDPEEPKTFKEKIKLNND